MVSYLAILYLRILLCSLTLTSLVTINSWLDHLRVPTVSGGIFPKTKATGALKNLLKVHLPGISKNHVKSE